MKPSSKNTQWEKLKRLLFKIQSAILQGNLRTNTNSLRSLYKAVADMQEKENIPKLAKLMELDQGIISKDIDALMDGCFGGGGMRILRGLSTRGGTFSILNLAYNNSHVFGLLTKFLEENKTHLDLELTIYRNTFLSNYEATALIISVLLNPTSGAKGSGKNYDSSTIEFQSLLDRLPENFLRAAGIESHLKELRLAIAHGKTYFEDGKLRLLEKPSKSVEYKNKRYLSAPQEMASILICLTTALDLRLINLGIEGKLIDDKTWEAYLSNYVQQFMKLGSPTP